MTWQSNRRKKQHGARPQPSAEAIQRKRERSDAERMASPCPPRPVEFAPGEQVGEIELRLHGRSMGVVTLHAPAKQRDRRSRVDIYEVRSPWGDVLVARGGLHAACRAAVARVWPRQMRRDAIAVMLSGL